MRQSAARTNKPTARWRTGGLFVLALILLALALALSAGASASVQLPYAGQLLIRAYHHSHAGNPYAQKIAFIRNDSVYIVDADGSHSQRLTKGGGDDRCPTWSSDHRSVYFVRHSGSTWRIAVVSAKTKKVAYVCYRDSDTGKSRKRWISAIAVKRSGKMIYFGDVYHGATTSFTRIVAIDLSQHTGRRVFRRSDYLDVIHTMSLSPNGKQLAFTLTGGDTGRYWLFNTTTKKSTHPINQSIVSAYWAPSGTKLVFSTYNQSPDHVFIASSNGSHAVDIPLRGAYGEACAFSSNGKRILFVSGSNLYTIALDGGNPQRVASCEEPADW